jgi:hypothetical protein
MPWSDDAWVMVHPFRAYAAIAAAGDDRPARTAAMRIAFLLVVIGAFVSLSAAGRLASFHVASTMVFWSFVPAVQAAAFAGVVRLLEPPPRPSLASALALYFTGHGPWMLFFVALSGVCLFVPDVYKTMMWLLNRGILPGLLLGVIGWSGLLTYACFRAGLGWSRRRAGAGTALFYLGFSGVIVGYYLAMNQIQPQAPWAQR